MNYFWEWYYSLEKLEEELNNPLDLSNPEKTIYEDRG